MLLEEAAHEVGIAGARRDDRAAERLPLGARVDQRGRSAMIAGHAASASSVRQPGSFDQLTGSKRAVGVPCTGAGLRVVAQAASSASAHAITTR